MIDTLYARLITKDELTVVRQAPMCEYTTFHIGGAAELLIQPKTTEGLIYAINSVKEAGVPLTLVGAGSNILVSDKGLPGAVIRIAKPMDAITIDGHSITAEAGATLAKIASLALEHNLTGFEFAGGIPGSLGGAVFMNAGAYGGEMKQVVAETTYLDAKGEIKTVTGDDHDFGYRTSMFAKTGAIVLSARLHLTPGDHDAIRDTMRDFAARRKEKQPLNFPSAGSVFKRPEGYFAGKLIEDAGLKGAIIGGAQISEKHAGFIVNIGNATAADVRALIEHAQKTVFEQTGVKLEPEIRMLGDFL